MLLRKIEALRSQPRHIRTRYAFFVSFLLTLSIALIWLFGVYTELHPTTGESESMQVVESSFARFWNDLQSSVGTTIQLLKPTTEYVREAEPLRAPNTLDLDALYATATQKNILEREKKEVGASASDTSATASTSVLVPENNQ